MTYGNDYAKFLENAPNSTRTEGMLIAKELLGELTPYRIVEMLHTVQVLLEPLFMAKVVDALSTNCLLRLNRVELALLNDFVRYENGLLNSLTATELTYKSTLVAIAMDAWIYQSVTNSLATNPEENCTTTTTQ